MITIENLHVSFGKKKILRDISCTFPDGSLTCLLALNGGGKTTLLRTIAGLQQPSHGRVLVDGKNIAAYRHPAAQLGIHLGTTSFAPHHTAKRHLQFLAALGGVPSQRVAAVLDATGLTSVAKSRIGSYSLGMRQRLGVATALLGDPHTLILDEPFNGLDARGKIWLAELLKTWVGQGKCAVFATHDLHQAETLCNQLLMLVDGEVAAAGRMAEVCGMQSLEEKFYETTGLATELADAREGSRGDSR